MYIERYKGDILNLLLLRIPQNNSDLRLELVIIRKLKF